MNQPASKEPTMDEILSSIRQIIADDDEAAARKPSPPPRKRAESAVATALAPEPAFAARQVIAEEIDPFAEDEDDAVPPLALSTEQIVPGDEEMEGPVEHTEATLSTGSFGETFVPKSEMEAAPLTPEQPATSAPTAGLRPSSQPSRAANDAIDSDEATVPKPEMHEDHVLQRPGIAEAASLPDPDLTRDLAEELLEPATGAAVRNAFARLDNPRLSPQAPIGTGGLTIENMLREMLRPMLKEWLDENLPAMVERLVEQEIERVSRGGR